MTAHNQPRAADIDREDSSAIEHTALLAAIFQENASRAIKRLGLSLAFNTVQTSEEGRHIVVQAMHIFEAGQQAEAGNFSQDALDRALTGMALSHLRAVDSFAATAQRLLPAKRLQEELPIGLKYAETAVLLRKYKVHNLAQVIEAGL